MAANENKLRGRVERYDQPDAGELGQGDVDGGGRMLRYNHVHRESIAYDIAARNRDQWRSRCMLLAMWVKHADAAAALEPRSGGNGEEAKVPGQVMQSLLASDRCGVSDVERPAHGPGSQTKRPGVIPPLTIAPRPASTSATPPLKPPPWSCLKRAAIPI
jgi:hypothetical protein